MRKIMFICVMAASPLCMIAQDNVDAIQEANEQQVIENSTPKGDEKRNLFNYYSAESEKAHSFSSEWSFFFQKDGWGAGFIRRMNFNPYASWNIIGVSYMSGWNNPADYGIVNFRFFGTRLHTPSYRYFRGYADCNIGYTLIYFDQRYLKAHNLDFLGEGDYTAHYFGLDVSVGIQIHKNIALGYNLSFIVNKNGYDFDHWAKVSFLFYRHCKRKRQNIK